MRLVLGFACLMPRFLLFACLNAWWLQTNAHSGAIPKLFSSSESQLHGGAGLGVAFFFAAVKGTNVNGEIRCLRSVIVIVACGCGIYIL
jgi:hypothetical protein